MKAPCVTARVYAMRSHRPTPQARRGAVKIWSNHVEHMLTSTLSAALDPPSAFPGLAELHVRLSDDGAVAELVRTTGSTATDAACLAAAQLPQTWPPPPPPITDAEFVVQIEFVPGEPA